MDPTLEEQIILAFNAVYMHFGEWSYADLTAGFQAVERQFAAVLGETDSLEVKRRVVEATLRAAQVTEQPVEHCLEVLRQLEQLGWSSRLGRANLLGAFCRYCLDHDRKDVGLFILAPTVAEIERDYADDTEEHFVIWLNGLRELLAELKAD